jgi:hypothetical protein
MKMLRRRTASASFFISATSFMACAGGWRVGRARGITRKKGVHDIPNIPLKDEPRREREDLDAVLAHRPAPRAGCRWSTRPWKFLLASGISLYG